ncbi:hypothetical protein HKX48_006042 [Thoreauomyces humboldtii]|nr:hypothetical protein HKX48_006042 [Thoreauomyces humboldtii]
MSPRNMDEEPLLEPVEPEKILTLLDRFLSANPENQRSRSLREKEERKLTEHHSVSRTRTKPGNLRDMSMSETQAFLVQLASALYAYGTPSHSLMYHMAQVAKGLGHEAHFECFPTHVFVSFRYRDEPAAYPLFFPVSSSMDMYKLELCDQLARRVASYGSSDGPRGSLARNRPRSDADLEAGLDRRSSGLRPGLLRAATMGSVGSFTAGLRRKDERKNRLGDLGRSSSLLSDVFKGRKRASNPERPPPSVLTASPDTDIPDHRDEPAIGSDDDDDDMDIRQWILDLASYGQGFFSTTAREAAKKRAAARKPGSSSSDSESGCDESSLSHSKRRGKAPAKRDPETTSVSAVDPSAEKTLKTDPKAAKKAAASASALADAFELIAVEDAAQRLKQIVSLPDYYPEWSQYLIAGAASGGGAGLFFGGGWADVLVSGILGTMVAYLGGWCEGQRTLDKVYEFMGAVIVSFAVRSLIHFGIPLCYSASILSSVMFLLQGVTITLALVELATRKMSAGVARLAFGVVMTGLIGYGLDLGATLAAGVWDIPKVPANQPDVCPTALGPYVQLALFLPTSLALSMSISAHPLQLPGMTVISAIGWAAYNAAAKSFSENLAVAIASFAVGVSSNVHAKWSGSPAIVNDLGGLSTLFPGGLAVRGIMKMIEGSENVVDGLGLSAGVLSVGLSLGLGLFMASVVIPLPAMRMMGGGGKRRGPVIENLHF